jgi:hypothetical protein
MAMLRISPTKPAAISVRLDTPALQAIILLHKYKLIGSIAPAFFSSVAVPEPAPPWPCAVTTRRDDRRIDGARHTRALSHRACALARACAMPRGAVNILSGVCCYSSTFEQRSGAARRQAQQYSDIHVQWYFRELWWVTGNHVTLCALAVWPVFVTAGKCAAKEKRCSEMQGSRGSVPTTRKGTCVSFTVATINTHFPCQTSILIMR